MSLKSLTIASLIAMYGLSAGTALALQVRFHQVSWLADSGGYHPLGQYSDTGIIGVGIEAADLPSLSPDGNGGFYGYLNVRTMAAGGSTMWSVQNRFVQFDSSDLDGRLEDGMFFDLGTGVGPVTSVGYEYGFSPIALDAPSFGFVGSSVVEQSDLLFGGGSVEGEFDGGTGKELPSKSEGFKGASSAVASQKTTRIKIKENETVPMDEEKNHCGPGSIAKSLKYLEKSDDRIKLGSLSAQQIYDDLKGRMGTTTEKGTYLDKWQKGKAEFVKEKKLPIETEYTTDIEKVAKCLGDGADIELFVYQGDGWGGHFTFVSEIVRQYDKDGKLIGYSVKTLNDLKQGDGKSGNDSITYQFDSTGKCTSHGKNAKLYGFLVEKPVPEPATLFGLAVGAAALISQRRTRTRA